MIRGVIFDLGSTLIEFKGDWDEVFAQGVVNLLQGLRAAGVTLEETAFGDRFRREMAEVDRARHIDYRERPTSSTVRRLLDEMGFEGVDDAAIEAAIERMFAVSETWWHPMPGVREVLETLRHRGYRLGMISNAGDAANARRLIRKTGVEDYFQPILISSEVGWRKPHEDIFLRVLRSWSVKAEEVVMVGDTLLEDILGAKNAGLRQIWLRADGQLQERMPGEAELVPDAVADTLTQVPALVENLRRQIPAG